MPKILQKYFIAIVPDGEIQEKATDLKLKLREKYNLKYALKSPSHITLKMPFLWNEAKEDRLVSQLTLFFQEQPRFDLTFRGIGKFGQRVIFIKVGEQPLLHELQNNLANFCKTRLNLKVEFSDSAYHPHMTVAFKDLKNPLFKEYFDFLTSFGFKGLMAVKEVALLKRENGRWAVCKSFALTDALSKISCSQS